jgi:hypothetical protein
MTHLLPLKRWHILPMLPLLISLACNSLTGAPSVGTYPTALVVETPNAVFGSGAYIFPDPTVGLSDLTGYTATLKVSFDGTEAGKPKKWMRTYVMLASKALQAKQLTIDKTGDLSDLAPVYMAEMAGTEYERHGQDDCSTTPMQADNSLSYQIEPASFLIGVIGADETGTENVNGVAARHGTFDQNALGQQGITESKGELWVASTGGYLVKYVLSSKAKADYFGEGIEGTITYDYELTDANKAPTITLPAGCPPGLVNAPQLPDATNVVSLPGVLSYDTSSKMKDVVAFYNKSLKDLGWKPQGTPTESDTEALLDYEQGGQVMTVVISSQDSITSVTILAGQPKPQPTPTP